MGSAGIVALYVAAWFICRQVDIPVAAEVLEIILRSTISGFNRQKDNENEVNDRGGIAPSLEV